MNKLFSLIGVLLLSSAMSFGQNPANKFTLSGKALGYVAGGQALMAADAVAEVKISDTLEARTDNIILSTGTSNANIAAFDLAGLQYTLPASKLFTAVKLDPAKYQAYAFGEGGSLTRAAGVTNGFSAGVGVNYQISNSVTANLFEVRYLHGPVPIGVDPTGNTTYSTNGVAFSIGLSFGN